MHQIPPDQQLLPIRFDGKSGMPRRMAAGLDGLNARHQYATLAEGFPLSAGQIRRRAVARHFEERLNFSGRRIGDLLRQPEVVVRLRDQNFGLREKWLAAGIVKPADMVAVQMGDDDSIDLRRLVARRFHILQHVTQRGAEQFGGAGIDQHQMAAGVDQIGVNRRLHLRIADKKARQQPLQFGRAGVAQKFCVQLDCTVIEGGNLELAKLGAVIAGHLRLNLRGFGLGERREAD